MFYFISDLKVYKLTNMITLKRVGSISNQTKLPGILIRERLYQRNLKSVIVLGQSELSRICFIPNRIKFTSQFAQVLFQSNI
jgi:hypothetical protein